MPAADDLAGIASNSPTAVQAVKRAVRLGEGQPTEQAVAIMMDMHWRSAVHPDRIQGIGAFIEGREPTFQDSDYWGGKEGGPTPWMTISKQRAPDFR